MIFIDLPLKPEPTTLFPPVATIATMTTTTTTRTTAMGTTTRSAATAPAMATTTTALTTTMTSIDDLWVISFPVLGSPLPEGLDDQTSKESKHTETLA